MSKSQSDLTDLDSVFTQLVDRVVQGEEITFTRNGRPVAKLISLPSDSSRPRQPGGWEGRARISDDFDGPLPAELQARFE